MVDIPANSILTKQRGGKSPWRSKTFPGLGCVIRVDPPEAHEFIWTSCARSFVAELSLNVKSSYITMIHSDKSIEHSWPFFSLREEENKIVALTWNTCSFSPSVSISNAPTVTAVVRPSDTAGGQRSGGLFLGAPLSTQGQKCTSESTVARVCNISHVLFRGTADAIDFVNLESRK